MSAEAVPTLDQYMAARRFVAEPSPRVRDFLEERDQAKNVDELRAAHDALWAGCR